MIILLLDSREHWLAQMWHKVIRFVLYIKQAVVVSVER